MSKTIVVIRGTNDVKKASFVEDTPVEKVLKWCEDTFGYSSTLTKDGKKISGTLKSAGVVTGDMLDFGVPDPHFVKEETIGVAMAQPAEEVRPEPKKTTRVKGKKQE